MKTKNPDRVPVPADNHPAPGVQHSPPAGYMQHDAENGVEVSQKSEFPPTQFYSTRKALENTIAMFRGTRPARQPESRKESSDEK
jgi:hypothetical protein